ncbi:BolA family protein [Sphingomonas sp. ac-8]|uniref:BolA family protein n=1 Tax=Sphingomonas sp. ac-8 TaxID=3242977 RepID=UPI003A8127CD
MHNTATGPVASEIAARLTEALEPTHLEVVNDSGRHAGHSGDNGTGESHFTVIIESGAFVGRSRVERQRLVNRALSDLLVERVHALAIRARAPGEES